MEMIPEELYGGNQGELICEPNNRGNAGAMYRKYYLLLKE
jgi:hypothetical protein